MKTTDHWKTVFSTMGLLRSEYIYSAGNQNQDLQALQRMFDLYLTERPGPDFRQSSVHIIEESPTRTKQVVSAFWFSMAIQPKSVSGANRKIQ